ncbi:MAG TPA: cell wall-binding repeat-containing protein, partial [Euzebya sp.]|nr:cell wall-binding repeat-containing protein [Euzebya sp.]
MPRDQIVSVLVFALAAAVLPAGASVAQEPPPVVSGRVADSTDATLASVDLSQAVFAAGDAEAAVVARGDVFADSLAGAALAGTTRPILYTTGGPDAALRPEVLAEVQRAVGPARGCDAAPDGEVLILGGTAAVSAAAEQQLTAAGYCTRRFAGASRVETSVQIADAVLARQAFAQDDPPPLLVSRDDNFADAATGGAYAALVGAPLVVTPTATLHPAVVDLLGRHNIGEAVLLGGEA